MQFAGFKDVGKEFELGLVKKVCVFLFGKKCCGGFQLRYGFLVGNVLMCMRSARSSRVTTRSESR